MKLTNVVQQWWSNKPYRALDQAYQSILAIKSLEDKHFNGKKISRSLSNYSDSVINHFENEVNRHLSLAKSHFNQFQNSGGLASLNNGQSADNYDLIEKVKLVDQYLQRYSNNNNLSNNSQIDKTNLDYPSKNTAVLPRSFLKTIKKIQQEIDPKSGETEEDVLNKFRRSRYKTAISIRFFLILIIVPLLTHQIFKTFIISPLLQRYSSDHEQVIFINQDFEEEAYQELKAFEEKLHFQELVGIREKTPAEEKEELLAEKAREIAESYKNLSGNAIANIFADMVSFVTFMFILVSSKKEIAVVKSFMDEIVYGLSDSAKAFLIILLTDIFVGYHSPHGWEVILEGITRHLGLPENREFNFLFIATFPVILDTVLKYWIFRYLNRISPSAVATYRNMNE